MELKFIWIKKHIVIERIGFNFNHSEEHRFEYTDNTLHLLPNTRFTLKFGPNVTGVTAIAGQNGSGKSSLCEAILQSTATLTNGALGINSRFDGIVCFGDHIFIHEELPVQNTEELASAGYRVVRFKDSPFEEMRAEWRDTFARGGFIYYSNILDYRTDFSETNLSNISTLASLNNSVFYSTSYPRLPRFRDRLNADNDKDKHGPFQIHYNVEGNRIVNFYLNHPQLTSFIPIPEFIIKSTYVGNNRWLKLDHLKTQANEEIFYQYIGNLEDILDGIFQLVFDTSANFDEHTIVRSNSQNFKQAIRLLYRYNLALSLSILRNVLPEPETLRAFVFDGIVPTTEEPMEGVQELLSMQESIVERSSIIELEDFKPLSLANQFEDTKDWRFYLLENMYLENTESNRAVLLAFMNKEELLLKGDAPFRRITNFNISPLSSGEHSLLTLFSRLHDVIYRYNIGRHEKEKLILFIDEAEIGFHPAWKRIYFDRLLYFLNNHVEGYGFQLIMTTHSPYLLSDLPHTNVILLKRQPNETTTLVDASQFKTFGANINELLATSFFLEEGLIGEFAQNKIQNLIDNLQTSQTDSPAEVLSKEEMDQMIDLIAEPFLREKLRDMFYDKYPEEFENDEAKQTRIQELENQLRRLKNG